MQTSNHSELIGTSPQYRERYAFCTLILLLSIAAGYYLSIRLISQLHYFHANNFYMAGSYNSAADELEKADHYLPDDYKISKGLAKVYYELGAAAKTVPQAVSWAQKAKDAAFKATSRHPLDAESFYDLARAEARLEQLYPYTFPEKPHNPYHAMPFYKKAIQLYPNSIRYYYSFVYYLDYFHRQKELLSAVTTLSRIYPQSYHDLKREAFWSQSIKEASRKGLEQAVDNGTSVKETHKALADLLAVENKYAEAITHLKASLNYRAFANNPGDYIHLGRLYLKTNQLEKAQDNFMQALSLSTAKEKDLQSIYNIFKREGFLQELYQFFQTAQCRFMFSSRIDILTVRCLIDLKQFPQAQKFLEDSIQKEPTAEAYYYLARIAEQERNWDNLELSIQKATVLDPQNSQYHLLFSQVLKRLKKLERAEKEAGLAIEHTIKPSPGLFNHRAWIRWDRQDFQGAAQDWQKAIELKPERADFYAHAGAANKKLGQWPQALNYYQKALRIDPQNKGYQKEISKLKKQ